MSITSTSQLAALVSHAHHKRQVVARCAQMTRVERRVRRGGQPRGYAQTRNRTAFGSRTCATHTRTPGRKTFGSLGLQGLAEISST